MRADAVRTRKALLEAAAEVFAEHGTDASVDQIVTRAGIGKGTCFRHFATKDDLLAAILRDEIDKLAEQGRQLAAHADPDAALLEFISAGVELHVRNRAFVDALCTTPTSRPPEIEAAVAQLIAAAESLAQRAQEHGSLRRDVTGQDVALLICGVYHTAASLLDAEPLAWKRYLRIIFEGMQVRAIK